MTAIEFCSVFAAGWFLGAAAQWAHFYFNRLIRTRREYYADRRARGLSVPDDWDEEDSR